MMEKEMKKSIKKPVNKSGKNPVQNAKIRRRYWNLANYKRAAIYQQIK